MPRFSSCAAIAVLCVSPTLVLADGPTLEQRLQTLTERLETQRQEMHVPGMAIAVVKDDQIILARGFGYRDLEKQTAADEHTMFAIGSSTKAFTAALVAMLVDEGKMQWDDPIRKHLPEFGLHDEEVAAQVTLRDTLSHRTGLNRTDLLWISGRASRADILEAITNAELYSPFRKNWHYNNIMFLAAGEASARAAGTDWDSLLAERLLKPMGMKQANSTYAAAQANGQLAKGYQWDADGDDFKIRPMRNIDSVAPAGSINASVTDMAQWVRLQLNRGEINGKRLISQEQIEEMWTPCMTVAPSMEYGLGWFVREWNGKRLIEHGGNIDGFAASLSLLPDENIGFVLLTNVSYTPLQGACHALVYEALLGDIEQSPELPMDDLQQYVGKYFFAPFNDHFEVLVKDGVLAVDVPGQMVYELKSPDEQGKWYFTLTDTIAVSFDRNDDGDVVRMKMYQAGMTFELPREGAVFAMEVDMQEVAPFLGTYHDGQMNLDVRVLVQNGRLAVDVPGQMMFELHSPDDEGRWYFRVTDTIYVTFEMDDDGEPTMTRYQSGIATAMKQTSQDEVAAVPTVEELWQLVQHGHRTQALREIESIRLVEQMRMAHQGIDGTNTILATADGRLRMDTDFGRFGYVHMAVVGDTAWVDSDIEAPEDEYSLERIREFRMRHPLVLFTDWNETFDDIQVQPSEHVDDRLVHRIRLTAGTIHRTLRIDAETGLIVGEQLSTIVPGIGRYTQEFRYAEHQEVHGLKLPFRTVMESDLVGKAEAKLVEAQVNVNVSSDAFASP